MSQRSWSLGLNSRRENSRDFFLGGGIPARACAAQVTKSSNVKIQYTIRKPYPYVFHAFFPSVKETMFPLHNTKRTKMETKRGFRSLKAKRVPK